ncbi:PLP-dependent aminotransferase family protein [Streptomyces cheonanensis]|uniref:PLP-dependent aminotransferase family protein n=1 Tax=Streptomyces cheonanensis TaxID=312720 RepID=A0ABN2UPJ0_9ACTN|nr:MULTISPECIES: PLP-dependent aminotransferase family protein [Streptomyces]QKV68672.1 PLP-dependent aminotransferase family protein [Streptomyces harbinensis]
MDDYRLIADRIAADITEGRLRPGDRLPPQRQFARQHAIAASTAARVYTELARRGLTVGEVGRGTFVRATPPLAPGTWLAEPADPTPGRIDLGMNRPGSSPEHAALLARGLSGLLRADVLTDALRQVGARGTPQARAAAATGLARAGWAPDPAHTLFTAGARQAIAAAISALVPPGERLGVERFTYPPAAGIAARLGVTLVPLDMDDDGVHPDALRATHRRTPLRALYLQPTLHNPLTLTMPPKRRTEIAATVRDLDLPVIEDAVFSFLREEVPPLAALAPERTVVVESLSKRISAGLTVGFALTPPALTERVATAVRTGPFTAAPYALAAATRWLTDGTAAEIAAAKRAEAAARQRIARERLAGFTVRADERSDHLWWELPTPWRADTFLAAAARRGIALAPAAAFTTNPAHAPHAVRIALATPPHDALAAALTTLAELARTRPEEARELE